MKNKLSNYEIEEIKKSYCIIFSTSNLRNEPHSIIVIPSKVEKDRIILSNIQMRKSIENLKSNQNCFINVYIKDKHDKQIKIDGFGKIYNEGELFNEIKKYEETNNLSEDLKVNSVIEVDFKNIEISFEEWHVIFMWGYNTKQVRFFNSLVIYIYTYFFYKIKKYFKKYKLMFDNKKSIWYNLKNKRKFERGKLYEYNFKCARKKSFWLYQRTN